MARCDHRLDGPLDIHEFACFYVWRASGIARVLRRGVRRAKRISSLAEHIKRIGVCVVGAMLLSCSAAAADPEYGKYLSSQCTTCHQLSGKSNGIPSIVGWDVESFTAVLQSYKRRERENKAMQNIAITLTDEDIAALAAYFATVKPQAN